MNPHRDCIWTERVAEEWIQGHPIGNGRLGAMVLGRPQDERLALNHDRLWRRYWQRQPRRTAADLPRVRELCAAGRWDAAFHALDAKIIPTGRGLYVNPFVPLGDLRLRLAQPERVTEYRRGLDLDAATAWVTYVAGGVRYARRAFASAPHGLIVLHLTADHAGALSGEVALSRLLDPDCVVDGGSALGEVALWGEFEEGVRFAAVAAVRQSGGRLTGGRRAYQPPEGAMPPKDLGGIQFIFRDPKEANAPGGASTCFDAADEVSILVAMAAGDDFAGDEPAELIAACRRQIAAASGIEALYPAHLQDHRRYYRRVELNLGDWTNDTPTDRRLDALSEHDEPPPELAELQFKLGRYLAVSSSRPGTAPMNLQGVWNQDRRPAWDSDYHLDMNLQMCYWPLPMANLADCMRPVFDWADAMLPQAREAASDLYGCRGIAFPAVNDLHALGNTDNLCFWWTGAAAWLGQLYWQYFAYTGDVAFLRERAVPFLEGIAEFYEDFLTEAADGRLLPIPSMSPEVGIKGGAGFLSPPSTMDLELIREVFTHLLEADRWTPLPPKALARWRAILARVPEPRVGPDGQLLEWWADVEPADPGHRHLSHLIGLTPGDRITRSTTPEAFAAAALAL
ncbi:MAG TPA: glycoside hydrolase family 95 protein, partial [Limnochordia bacterium]|nr:glycoside hydrolase family 95 protein [Limnochordia bacterium]